MTNYTIDPHRTEQIYHRQLVHQNLRKYNMYWLFPIVIGVIGCLGHYLVIRDHLQVNMKYSLKFVFFKQEVLSSNEAALSWAIFVSLATTGTNYNKYINDHWNLAVNSRYLPPGPKTICFGQKRPQQTIWLRKLTI